MDHGGEHFISHNVITWIPLHAILFQFTVQLTGVCGYFSSYLYFSENEIFLKLRIPSNTV